MPELQSGERITKFYQNGYITNLESCVYFLFINFHIHEVFATSKFSEGGISLAKGT
jgi:hypothetical protein